MPSTIDPSVPVFGTPTTLSVRQNFQRAYNELTPLLDGNLLVRVGTAESNIVALQSSVGTLQSDVADLKAAGPGSGNGTISALTTRVTNAESAIGLLQTRMGTAESNIAALGDLSALTTRVSTAEGNIGSLTTRVGTAETNIGSLTTRIGTAEGRITVLEAAGPGGGLPTTGGTLANPSAATALNVGNAGGIFLPQMNLQQANNTLASPAAVTSSVQLGQLQWQGYNGSVYGTGANIYAQVATGVTFSTSNMNTRLIFQTCRENSPNLQIAFQIGVRGGLVIGTAGGGDQGPGTINAQNIYTAGTVYIAGIPLDDYIKAVVGI